MSITYGIVNVVADASVLGTRGLLRGLNSLAVGLAVLGSSRLSSARIRSLVGSIGDDELIVNPTYDECVELGNELVLLAGQFGKVGLVVVS